MCWNSGYLLVARRQNHDSHTRRFTHAEYLRGITRLLHATGVSGRGRCWWPELWPPARHPPLVYSKKHGCKSVRALEAPAHPGVYYCDAALIRAPKAHPRPGRARAGRNWAQRTSTCAAAILQPLSPGTCTPSHAGASVRSRCKHPSTQPLNGCHQSRPLASSTPLTATSSHPAAFLVTHPHSCHVPGGPSARPRGNTAPRGPQGLISRPRAASTRRRAPARPAPPWGLLVIATPPVRCSPPLTSTHNTQTV